MKNSIKTKKILLLQFTTILFTISGIFGKLASKYDFLSLKFLLFYGLDLFVLGVYAIIWQQVIKKTDISIAYLNKATHIFWSMIFAFLIFKESISITNIVGVIIIFIGIIMVNKYE